jgi:opacity protein-like surface antigen
LLVEFASGGGSVQGDKFSLLGTIGVDLNLFEGVAILADFNTNFGSRSGLTVGLGFEF